MAAARRTRFCILLITALLLTPTAGLTWYVAPDMPNWRALLLQPLGPGDAVILVPDLEGNTRFFVNETLSLSLHGSSSALVNISAVYLGPNSMIEFIGTGNIRIFDIQDSSHFYISGFTLRAGYFNIGNSVYYGTLDNLVFDGILDPPSFGTYAVQIAATDPETEAGYITVTHCTITNTTGGGYNSNRSHCHHCDFSYNYMSGFSNTGDFVSTFYIHPGSYSNRIFGNNCPIGNAQLGLYMESSLGLDNYIAASVSNNFIQLSGGVSIFNNIFYCGGVGNRYLQVQTQMLPQINVPATDVEFSLNTNILFSSTDLVANGPALVSAACERTSEPGLLVPAVSAYNIIDTTVVPTGGAMVGSNIFFGLSGQYAGGATYRNNEANVDLSGSNLRLQQDYTVDLSFGPLGDGSTGFTPVAASEVYSLGGYSDDCSNHTTDFWNDPRPTASCLPGAVAGGIAKYISTDVHYFDGYVRGQGLTTWSIGSTYPVNPAVRLCGGALAPVSGAYCNGTTWTVAGSVATASVSIPSSGGLVVIGNLTIGSVSIVEGSTISVAGYVIIVPFGTEAVVLNLTLARFPTDGDFVPVILAADIQGNFTSVVVNAPRGCGVVTGSQSQPAGSFGVLLSVDKHKCGKSFPKWAIAVIVVGTVVLVALLIVTGLLLRSKLGSTSPIFNAATNRDSHIAV